MTKDCETLGQLGYEAYAISTGGKTWDGKPMPTFAEILKRTPHVAKAWEDAADAIRESSDYEASILQARDRIESGPDDLNEVDHTDTLRETVLDVLIEGKNSLLPHLWERLRKAVGRVE